ncbi:MAG: FtsQ-type POTRA domain-containing protein [Acidimicrobiales bacterium]
MTPIDPRIRERRIDVARRRGRRRLAWVCAGAGVVAAAGIVLAALHTPWMSAQVLMVTGRHPNTPTAAIDAAAGLDGHPPLIDVDPGSVAARIERLPYVAGAEVRRQWPDGVQIRVTERVPAVQMAGPKTGWSILDAHGRTLGVVPSPAGLVVLVVLGPSGDVPPAPVGQALGQRAAAGLSVCHSLPPAFAGQVVTVTEAADATVSLYLNSGLTVLLGTTVDLTAKYEDVAAIIAHASLTGAKTIDVTVPQSPTVAG